MRKISQDRLNIQLPMGFRLLEDEDHLYLYFGQEEVARFSIAGVNPREIIKAAEEHEKGLPRQ